MCQWYNCWNFDINLHQKNPIMIKNYLLVVLRNLRKYKNYVIINTLGMGIALACCITAYLLLAYNIEFDSFHADEKVDKIYRVHTHHVHRTSGQAYQSIAAPINLAPRAVMEISGIERYTRYAAEGGYVWNGKDSFNENLKFADSTFFEMFDFPLIHGSHRSFKNLNSIFLSEEIATKYFNDEDPVGKMLTLNFVNQKEINVVVGGVVRKVPLNNSFTFDMVMRIEHFMDIHNLDADNWRDWRDPATFFEVSTHEQASVISQQMDKYIERRNNERKDLEVKSFQLKHFKSKINQDETNWGQINLRLSPLPLVVFVSMATIILLIACFNMTNTFMAMTAKRMKEVGIRKVIGAVRWQLISQFLFEAIIIIVLALIAGISISQAIVPTFADMWQLEYGMKDLSGLNLLITFLVLVFFTSLLTGIYPAIFNSRVRPVVLLKGNTRIKGTNNLTRSLITIQFALSVIVLIAGVVFIQNTKFQEAVDFGYDKEMVLLVKVQGEKEYDVMEKEVSLNPRVQKVGGTAHSLGWNNYPAIIKIGETEHEVRHYGIGKNYLEVMGLGIDEGRNMNLENEEDVRSAVVINKAFLEKIDIEDPIMKAVEVHGVKRRIVGISENHLDNVHRTKEPEPALFYPAMLNQYQFLLVRANPDDLESIKEFLEEAWKRKFPDKPFQYHFHEELLLGGVRSTNANLKKIFIFLTILGGMLSASGIFALASLNTEKRLKEIGIRKTLGASLQSILALMNKEFVIILTVAGILGSLGGYYLTEMLLGKIYAYHISVGIIPVVMCSLLIFIVGIATTGATIMKAAKSNPVDTLRDE